MARERISVGTRRGTKQESFFNPGDIFQFFRRESTPPTPRRPAGYGFYQGKPEFSLGFNQHGYAPQREAVKQRAISGLGQESIYGEGRRGYTLTGAGGTIAKTKYKWVIHIKNGRKLADTVYPRDVYKYQTLQRAISDEKSSNYLFAGGTVYESGRDLIITSAEFDEKSIPTTRVRIESFMERLRTVGFQVRVELKRAR